ncbi:MAG: hypothetical protein R2861_02265 [Desulfobacterales bacterium]
MAAYPAGSGKKHHLLQLIPVIFASDTDAAAVQKLAETVHVRHLSTTIRVGEMDFFALRPRDLSASSGVSAKTGLIVLNPPYGRRLGSRVRPNNCRAHLRKADI